MYDSVVQPNGAFSLTLYSTNISSVAFSASDIKKKALDSADDFNARKNSDNSSACLINRQTKIRLEGKKKMLFRAFALSRLRAS